MVHALHILYDLLKPGGTLIDIHPSGSRPELFALSDSRRRFLGYLEEAGGFVEYAQAQSALDEVVQEGIFRLDHTGQFDFATHAVTLAALEEYLAENWKNAILTPDVLEKTKAACSQPGMQELLVAEQIAIARLRVGE